MGSGRGGRGRGRGRVGTAALLAALLAAPCTAPAGAQDGAPTRAGGTLSPGSTFSERSGDDLFANVCRGCHMDGARGAAGAGAYPSLAGDGNLASAGYVTGVVVNGLRGMPALGWAMDDDQVAAVATYVRTHFGNAYADPVTAADAKGARR